MFGAYVIKQYERAVVFRLGKVEGKAREPGLMFCVPFVNRIHRVSLRIVTRPIQSQGIITKDNVSIDVSAVAYYRVEDPVGDRDRERAGGDRSDRADDVALGGGASHPG
jgi:regulator of protease activity HflC (stomatin/prohibitin superfamily)